MTIRIKRQIRKSNGTVAQSPQPEAIPKGSIVQSTLQEINKGYYDTLRSYKTQFAAVTKKLKRREYSNPRGYAKLYQKQQMLKSMIAVLQFG